MRPILAKGHERPLTYIKFNREGDIFFSCAKDHHPTLWYTDSGERIGTYLGHNGAVWSCDVTRDTRRLVTASADTTFKLWDVQSGKELYSLDFEGPARYTCFSTGEKMCLLTTDAFMGHESCIRIMEMNWEDDSMRRVSDIYGHQGRITRAVWGPLNKTIISTGEDRTIRQWDVETGKELMCIEDAHKKIIQDLEVSLDGTQFITGSLDRTAKLWDIFTLEEKKCYTTERPLNAVALSPLLDHIVVGGGQDAAAVTTTSAQAGGFEAMFIHKIYEEYLGGVKGHFGPINALAISPDGRSFVSGGEDGFIRVHHFDADYFQMK